jgi:hypothetical protein
MNFLSNDGTVPFLRQYLFSPAKIGFRLPFETLCEKNIELKRDNKWPDIQKNPCNLGHHSYYRKIKKKCASLPPIPKGDTLQNPHFDPEVPDIDFNF